MEIERRLKLLTAQSKFVDLAPRMGDRSPYMDHQLIESRLQDLDEGLKEIAKRIAGGIGRAARSIGRAAVSVGRKLIGRKDKPEQKKSRDPMSPRGGHNVKVSDSCPTPRTKTSVDGAPEDSKRCNDQTADRWHRR